ncbi:MAG: hypothetical protein WCO65_00445 [bacterium]
MDKTFQTSFIPKKPTVEAAPVEKKFTLGIFGFIGVLLFVISTALAVGVYFYEKNLVVQLADKQAQLNNARNAIEFPLIDSAKTLGRRITDANQILSNHIIVSPIFSALQLNTLKSIQFNQFTYATPTDQSGKVSVQMNGVARDYTSIALESDQLAKNKDIQNPIFSGLALDPQTGTVSFTLNFTVSSDLVSFVKHVSDYVVATSTTSVVSQ